MTYIRLLKDRVHLMHLKPRLVSDGGIHLTERYADDQMLYQVLGAGPKAPPEVSYGAQVVIPMMQDSVTLPDGSLICSAKLIHAVVSQDNETNL